MNISSERYVDWNQVPDMKGMVPSGIIQWRILDYEEKMSDGTGFVEKGDRAGQQKIAKLMYVMSLEGIAPEEAVGVKRFEYFVIGTDEDPMANNTQTLYESLGVRQLKNVLAAAQIPWSNGLVSTMAASLGALFCQQVNHKRDTYKNEPIVSVVTGRVFKIGEMQPRYIPCTVEPDPNANFSGCLMCIAARQQGKGAPVMPQGMPVNAAIPTMPQAPKPVMPTAPQPAMPSVAPQMAPVSVPNMGPGVTPPQPVSMPQNVPQAPQGMPQGMPVNPPQVAQPVVGMPPGNVPTPPAPQGVPVAPIPAPAMTAAPVAPMPSQVAPVPSNPVMAPAPTAVVQGMNCTVCGQMVSFTDLGAHMAAHQAGQPVAAPGFKQET